MKIPLIKQFAFACIEMIYKTLKNNLRFEFYKHSILKIEQTSCERRTNCNRYWISPIHQIKEKFWAFFFEQQKKNTHKKCVIVNTFKAPNVTLQHAHWLFSMQLLPVYRPNWIDSYWMRCEFSSSHISRQKMNTFNDTRSHRILGFSNMSYELDVTSSWKNKISFAYSLNGKMIL